MAIGPINRVAALTVFFLCTGVSSGRKKTDCSIEVTVRLGSTVHIDNVMEPVII